MSNKAELLKAYEAIFLDRLNWEIDRDERDERLIALSDSPMAAGLTEEETHRYRKTADEQIVELREATSRRRV